MRERAGREELANVLLMEKIRLRVMDRLLKDLGRKMQEEGMENDRKRP